jgi:hypothetical protein
MLKNVCKKFKALEFQEVRWARIFRFAETKSEFKFH